MQRLKKIIEQYGRWFELTTYTERIEAHTSSDFSHAIENAKALLETIGKEICKSKGVELGETASINAVMKKAFTVIGYSSNSLKGGYPLDSPKISGERRNMLKTKDLSEISPKFCGQENINKNSKLEI